MSNRFRVGMLFAVGSAVSFGMSGPLAKSLMVAGWSPTAAVLARLAGGALVLAVVATVVKPDWLSQARAHARTVVLYGLIPVAGAQLCYYNAVAHLSVGVALLLEYTAPVLVIGWVWATTGRRPSGRMLGGVALAVIGISLVLDVAHGARVDAVGVAWGLGAAICAVCYFMMSDEVTADGTGLHAMTLAAGSLIVATVAVGALGALGVMPLRFTADDVVIAGATLPWLVPVVVLGVLATAIAYLLGISGVARLRPSFASLMGLGEVLFAVVAAWLLLDEHITTIQAVGGIVVLLGLALARPADNAREDLSSAQPDSVERITVSSPARNLEQSTP